MKNITLIIFFLLISINLCNGEEYTNEQIADSIFLAEGGYKTNYPFGIKSVYCDGYDSCRKICLNTISNNRIRYSEYGYKQYDNFIEFLGSRYCNISINGCENWVYNVRYFLKKGK